MTSDSDFDLCKDLDILSPTPLVTFLHSSSPLSNEALSDPESAGIRFSLSPSTPSSGPVFSAATERMRYAAAAMEDLSSPYYVAARDRSSGKLRLLPTQIFQLSPQIASKSRRTGEEGETEGTSSREKRAELTRAFGSSKAKRKLASAELSRNDPEFLADSMEKTLSGVEVEEAEGTTSSLLLPPHHAEGEDPAEIFLLEELLSEGVLNSASSYAREIRNAGPDQLEQWGVERRYGEYVSSWMSEERLAQLREHSRYHFKPLLKALVCLHFLISFYLVPAKKHSKSLLEEIDFIPGEVKEFCLASFTERSIDSCGEPSYSLSRRVKDKLLLYILTLALVLEGYKMDASCLVSSLNILAVSARKYFLAIGCKFVSNFPKKRKLENGEELNNSMKLFLAAPLKLPKRFAFRK